MKSVKWFVRDTTVCVASSTDRRCNARQHDATSSKKYVYTSSAVNPSPNNDGSYGKLSCTSAANCIGCAVNRNPSTTGPVTSTIPADNAGTCPPAPSATLPCSAETPT